MSIDYHPTDYQKRLIEWIAERDYCAEFASPGLGKTATVLTEIDRALINGEHQGVLFVCPIRVGLITIPNEVKKWNQFKWMRVVNLRTPEGCKAWEDGSADIYLINPEQLPSKTVNRTCGKCKGEGCKACDGAGVRTTHHAGFVERHIKGRKTLPATMLVVDEISTAKNHRSKRFNALRAYNHHFTKRIGLTGTPVPNDYLDLFAQVRLLDDGKRLGKSFHQYRAKWFEQSDYMGYSYRLRPGAREKIDAAISDLALVMLGDDYLDVPTCNSVDEEVDLSGPARKAYRTMEKELLLQLEQSDVVALNAATLTMKLVQLTSGCVYDEDGEPRFVHDIKLKRLQAIRKRHKDDPILVLTMFKHEKRRVLAAIPGAREFHEKDMAEWQAGKIHTWVADPRSLSHGIDGIQKGGRIAVWMSMTYSNETYLQTNARLVRTGQSFETIIYRILARDTIDEAVVEALRTKDGEQQSLLHALKNLQKMRT